MGVIKEVALIFIGESWLQIITTIRSDRVVLEHIPVTWVFGLCAIACC